MKRPQSENQKLRPSRTRSSAQTVRSAPRVAASDPMRQLWLAALGAASGVGEAAERLVETLVERGREREPLARARAAETAEQLRGIATRLAAEAERRCRGAIDAARRSLGVVERRRPKNVLHRLGDLAEAIF